MTSVHSLSVYFFSVYTRSNPLEHGGPWSSNFWRRQRHPFSTTLPTHNFPSPGRLPTSLRNAWREGAGVNSRTFTIPPPGAGGCVCWVMLCARTISVYTSFTSMNQTQNILTPIPNTRAPKYGDLVSKCLVNPTEASSSRARRCCRSLASRYEEEGYPKNTSSRHVKRGTRYVAGRSHYFGLAHRP